MIKTFEELGESLADIENRLSYLENSQHFYEPQPTQTEQPETKWSRRQWDFVKQTKGMILNVDKKIKELMALLGITYSEENGALVLKKKPKSKYD